MRITDLMMTNSFLQNLTTTKSKVSDLQTEISLGTTIQKPSDSPNGTVNILGWNNQITQANTIMGNIDSGLAFVNDSTQAMQNIQDQITNVLSSLTQVQNAANSQNLGNFADQIDSSLSLILDSANTQSNGKYVFAGTDLTNAPFGYTADGKSIEVKDSNISGAQNIRISPNVTEQINLSGTDVFGTIVKGGGSIDSTTAVGATVTNQTSVYDAQGNQFTFKANFTKTAANTYNFTYDILDSSNNSVLSSPPAAQSMVFDSITGNLQSVNSKPPALIQINVPANNINFSYDPTAVNEKAGASSLTFTANQKTDIFNTLINISNNLKAGIKPTADQMQAITDFNNSLLNNISKSGNIANRLTNSKSLLNNKTLQLQDLISKTDGVDIAKASVDLTSQETLLQMSYQMASKVLPQSLLNYL
jgi:flagellar hook-associated protein 3 FlgL